MINNILSLTGTMPKPHSFGLMHITCLLIIIYLTFKLITSCLDVDEKTFRKILSFFYLIMLVLELIKQVSFSVSYIDNKLVFEYDASIFPFQLCSTPLYVLPLIIVLKDSKFRDSCISYISTFCVFGGLTITLFPGYVFGTSVIGNFQTLVHHSLQVLTGTYIAFYYRNKFNYSFFKKGVYFFQGAFLIALFMNILAPLFTTDEFNMFFIGPVYATSLFILKEIYSYVPHIVFLLLYNVGFMLISYVIYRIYFQLIHLLERKGVITIIPHSKAFK